MNLHDWLFIAALLIYFVTRLVSLSSFPIYFFTDEAVQTVLAQDFIRDDFRNYDKELLPTYFVNGNQYNLSISVYLQIIPFLLFGKSVFVTRSVGVLVSLLAASAVGLLLRDVFKLKYYWMGTLLLSITPAWFLHSRTAFETSLAVSFFAAFMYCYWMYRTINPRYLYAAVVFGALCFYSYSPAQVVIGLLVLILWFSDLKYHLNHKRIVLISLAIALLCAIPYIRFLILHGRENYEHLFILRSYWVSNITLGSKLLTFLKHYARGLNPAYWFIPNSMDFTRHLMKDYGHILPYALPFFTIGLVICLCRFRQSRFRGLLFAVLAAPAGAALVEIGITRALFMVIPAALITALGLNYLLNLIQKIHLPSLAVSLPVFALLAGVNVTMLVDALLHGPTWFQNYTLGGMQYGAPQLFGEIKRQLIDDPGKKLVVSPNWSNGTDVVARFFLSDPLPITLASIDGFMSSEQTLDSQATYVFIPEEVRQLRESGKFTDIQIDKVLHYPNGQPGFYFMRLEYVDDIEDILAAERASWHTTVTGSIQLPGEGPIVQVSHSALDMGSLKDLFDGDDRTVARTRASNPMVIDLLFTEPFTTRGVIVKVGGVKTTLSVAVYSGGNDQPMVHVKTKEQTIDPEDMSIDFGDTLEVDRVHIEVLSVNDQEPAHVHVWEVTLITDAE